MSIDAILAALHAKGDTDYVRREDEFTPRGEGTVEIWQLPSGEWVVSKITYPPRAEHHFATEQEAVAYLRADMNAKQLAIVDGQP